MTWLSELENSMKKHFDAITFTVDGVMVGGRTATKAVSDGPHATPDWERKVGFATLIRRH
jgi:hypothetical protein